MQATWQWGLELIRSLQSIRHPAIDGFFRAVTVIGNAETYLMLLVPLFFWCIDFGAGAEMGNVLVLSGFLNIVLKRFFSHPRPFELDERVRISAAKGYGFPSGHAQLAVVGWGFIALHIGRAWSWLLGVAMMLLIGVSRVYLGVHFPTDVLAGWLVGAALLLLFAAARRRIVRWLDAAGARWQVLLALALPASMFLAWPQGRAATLSGILAGLDLGLIVSCRFLRTSFGGAWWQRGSRMLVGAAGIVLLFVAFEAVDSGAGALPGLLLVFAITAAFGLWISLGAPWLFDRFRWLFGPSRETR